MSLRAAVSYVHCIQAIFAVILDRPLEPQNHKAIWVEKDP